ncbi:MAG: endonuclease MutS2 [Candidatus Obscuribacterales bacterium]|nr:endonuclease MutS2 [Candidatus Obscuribacterales bacterium]
MDANARTLKSLEWERLKSYLAAECSSACSRELALELELHEDALLINCLLQETAEALRAFNEGQDLGQEALPDLRKALDRLQTAAALSASELLDLKRVLEASRKLKILVSNLDAELYQSLRKILKDLFVFDDLVSAIDAVVDENARIKDDASPLLRKLKKELLKLNGQVKDELQKIINSPAGGKCLQEPIYTMRNGRHVLPVLANMRSSIEGIVHDSSSTGLTIYVEPKSVVELSNNIRINEAEIERETERLLWELSLIAAKKFEEIELSFNALVEADFIAARARLAWKYGGTLPRLNLEKFEIRFLQARHPLLILQSGRIDAVVPNDILLDASLKTLIITGPNTGGKTVYLKTAGLLSLMLRAGLLLPVEEGSSSGIFTKVFADIGDEQSLEQNLSTFSSHMSNIVEITNNASAASLVLLDEIGAGTDPREGVILARVVLEHLNRASALTICSTHYGDLKTLAHSHSSYGNASMDFDDKNMKPSYRLRQGLAGSSRAIAVAARLGLNSEMVLAAEQALASEKQDFEHKIDELENRLRMIAEQEDDLKKKREEMALLSKEFEEKSKALEAERLRSRLQAANQFQDDYQRAKKAINDLTAELQKSPSLARAQEARQRLESIKKDLSWLSPEELQAQQAEFSKGQTVRVRSLNQIGILEDLPESNSESAQVRIGQLKVKVALRDLEHCSASARVAQAKSKNLSNRIQDRKAVVKSEDPVFVRSSSNTLDLRGQRVDEGLALLERFIDEAYLAELSPLMVIHGHGTGAMKAAVRDYLNSCSYKNKSRSGEPYEGGDGVTVVNFLQS